MALTSTNSIILPGARIFLNLYSFILFSHSMNLKKLLRIILTTIIYCLFCFVLFCSIKKQQQQQQQQQQKKKGLPCVRGDQKL